MMLSGHKPIINVQINKQSHYGVEETDEETGNYNFFASLMLLSYLLSHINLFRGVFAPIKD